MCRFESYPGQSTIQYGSSLNSSVAGIVLSPKKDSVLLVQRRDVPVWVLPGGGKEADETPEQAVLREVLEETGLTVSIVRKVAEYRPANNLTKLTYLFECLPSEGMLTTGAETFDVKFFPVKDLPKRFFFLHDEWLQDCLKNESTVIHKELSQINYWIFAKYFLLHPFLVARYVFSRLGFPINKK